MNVRFGAFEVDSAKRQLLKNGSEIHVTRKAFDLLLLLIGEAPRVVGKEELHQRLWTDSFVSDATLVGLVKEVRRVLHDPDAKKPLIRTAHGIGYAFSGELQRSMQQVPTASCWVVVGTRRVMLIEGENLIGRDAASTIHLDAPGVSRRHARIVVDASGAVVEDLGSKNGTMVNDTPASGGVVLRDGDRIQAGPIVISYHASAAAMSTETSV